MMYQYVDNKTNRVRLLSSSQVVVFESDMQFVDNKFKILQEIHGTPLVLLITNFTFNAFVSETYAYLWQTIIGSVP